MGSPSNLVNRASRIAAHATAADPTGSGRHAGDVNWMFADQAAHDPKSWLFATDGSGEDIGFAHMAGDFIVLRHHPDASAATVAELLEDGLASFPATEEVWTDIGEDEELLLELADEAGFEDAGGWRFQAYVHALDPIPSRTLPDGYTLLTMENASPDLIEERAAVHRAAFWPYTSKTVEMAVARHRRTMATPLYEPRHDLAVRAPNGELAAGCIVWFDPVSATGQLEPLGTHPDHRRKGIATTLTVRGVEALAAAGAHTARVLANHPGEKPGSTIPLEFTSSRFAFTAAGFEPTVPVRRYRRAALSQS